jgi:hypothetical protein
MFMRIALLFGINLLIQMKEHGFLLSLVFGWNYRSKFDSYLVVDCF